MYDQNVITFIHEFLNKSINEISRITNLHVSEIPVLVANTRRALISTLQVAYGPFLGDKFDLLVQIIEDNITENIGSYPTKLHDAEKLIITQYRRLEVDMQGGLSKATSVEEYKAYLMAQNNQMASNLKEIEKSNNGDALKSSENTFNVISQKVDTYFSIVGLTNESLCREIKQIIDIYEQNLLSKIDDKIDALVYIANDNVQVLLSIVLSKISTPIQVVPATQNATPEPSMFKM